MFDKVKVLLSFIDSFSLRNGDLDKLGDFILSRSEFKVAF